jgi:prepilin-type N-terminal cleavage/methylation domain-containing protein/prepilin-type processing-associated H-X9-DG protein
MSSPVPSSRRAFSLIELLVVIGLIGVLIALLLPALSQARRQARCVQCKANLREVFLALQIYQNRYNGWIFPASVDGKGEVRADRMGYDLPPHERWPMKVFTTPSAPLPPMYDPLAYDMEPYDPRTFDPYPYTPPVLRCPADAEPFEAHSYVLNGHLADRRARSGSGALATLNAAGVIVAGEKVSDERDYYVQTADFYRVVEPYRHGRQLKSNYLFLDGHVDNVPPQEARGAIDPWDVAKNP